MHGSEKYLLTIISLEKYKLIDNIMSLYKLCVVARSIDNIMSLYKLCVVARSLLTDTIILVQVNHSQRLSEKLWVIAIWSTAELESRNENI